MKSKGGLGIFYSPFVCHIVCMCFGIEWFSSQREREREMNWELFWLLFVMNILFGS